ncbi:MAG: thiamine-phosphate kinase [Leptolyngbyaceae cyanobacterium bins.302]|nr:thiamine-phosphate kinase [Leptolyngbyaceae cyanobacterium bins.302]
MNVRDIGEQGLLQRLQAFCPEELVGDDAAILTPSPEQRLIVTTDVLVDGVHFSDRTTSPQDAGWRAAAANLSDLAAMGATPMGITVGLGLPGDLAVAWVDGLYQGLTECLQPFDTPIVGGDVVRSPVTTIAITAFGQAHPDRIMRRSTAQPHQAIVITGYHGTSRAGLELLLNPSTPPLAQTQQDFFVKSHQRPNPRLDVLPLLRTVTDSVVTGMDSSDGLADAVIQICRASGVGARLERSRLPTPPGLNEWVGQEQAIHWTLYGGEDFELVLCLPSQDAEKLVAQLGEGAAIIGTTTVEPGIELIGTDGNPASELTLEQGFQHYF